MPTSEEIEFIRAATSRFVQRCNEERERAQSPCVQSAATPFTRAAPTTPRGAYERLRAALDRK